MKTSFALLLFLVLFSQLPATAQDLEKMNKNELRDYSILLLGKIDSLNTQINSLQATGKQLATSLASSEQKNASNLTELQKLSALIVKTQQELERVQTEKNAVITSLNANVLLLKDSISTLQQSFLSAASGTPNDPNDFLNSY
jgi:chromosome segregation ATPase